MSVEVMVGLSFMCCDRAQQVDHSSSFTVWQSCRSQRLSNNMLLVLIWPPHPPGGTGGVLEHWAGCMALKSAFDPPIQHGGTGPGATFGSLHPRDACLHLQTRCLHFACLKTLHANVPHHLLPHPLFHVYFHKRAWENGSSMQA